jgi:hypothetical protein
MLDVRDGLLITINSQVRRLRRRGLQNIISYSLNQGEKTPAMYCVQGDSFLVAPTPDITYSGTVWFYQRPTDLEGATVTAFPSDLVLIEYVRIKAMEWIRAAPPGAALGFARREIVELRKSGLGGEPENEDLPLDPHVFVPGSGLSDSSGYYDWMGPA